MDLERGKEREREGRRYVFTRSDINGFFTRTRKKQFNTNTHTENFVD